MATLNTQDDESVDNGSERMRSFLLVKEYSVIFKKQGLFFCVDRDGEVFSHH